VPLSVCFIRKVSFSREFFWKSIADSIVGAIPAYMLTVGAPSQAVASSREHEYIRIRDGDLLTARESHYWHYLFDLKLNT
jgi:hypothetical protein